MRLARLPVALLCLVALIAMPSCGSSPVAPSTGTRSVITLTVSPSPIVAAITNTVGPVYTATWTTTLTESGGVGAGVTLVKASVFDNASGKLAASTTYDDKDLLVFVGKNRVEANGTLVVPLQVSYILSTLDRAASLTVTTTAKDDKGNAIESSLLVKIQ
jgi:hypothetical protein